MYRIRSRRCSLGILTYVAAGGMVCGACASSASRAGATRRLVDTPAWSTVQYGAPKDRTYTAEVSTERDVLRLRVYEKSLCDVIPIQVVDRVEETVEDDEVVSRRNLGTHQIAGEPTESIPCSESATRDAEVALRVGTDSFVLGTTDRNGLVVVNLSERLRRSLYGDSAPEEALVTVRGPKDTKSVEAGRIALASLQQHEERVTQLLEELTSILDKGQGVSSADIQRSYTLYSQLRQLAYNDARFRGAAARFWELLYGRKQQEATAKLTRNLEALAKARDLLKTAGLAALPVFAQAAIDAGGVEPRVVEWAEWQLLSGLRTAPAACQSAFAWSALDSYGFEPVTLIAARYLQFARGNGYAASARALCKWLAR